MTLSRPDRRVPAAVSPPRAGDGVGGVTSAGG